MNITSTTNCPDNETRKLEGEVVYLLNLWLEKAHPQPGQAEELLVMWLMLLQLPIHPKKLQGPMVEELILSGEG